MCVSLSTSPEGFDGPEVLLVAGFEPSLKAFLFEFCLETSDEVIDLREGRKGEEVFISGCEWDCSSDPNRAPFRAA